MGYCVVGYSGCIVLAMAKRDAIQQEEGGPPHGVKTAGPARFRTTKNDGITGLKLGLRPLRNGDRHQGVKAQTWSETREEHAEWTAAAKAEGMTLSAWLRRAANRAVLLESNTTLFSGEEIRKVYDDYCGEGVQK